MHVIPDGMVVFGVDVLRKKRSRGMGPSCVSAERQVLSPSFRVRAP